MKSDTSMATMNSARRVHNALSENDKVKIARRWALVHPEHSQDLSPIEMIWTIIKCRLKGRRFNNEIELFTAIQAEWDLLVQRTIDNLLSSFRARCQICVAHNGESLKGHWREVHALHHGAATYIT
jgi:transposase